jgi:hypothetical protein
LIIPAIDQGRDPPPCPTSAQRSCGFAGTCLWPTIRRWPKPWELPAAERQPINYPDPIVDHAQARAAALHALEVIKKKV